MNETAYISYTYNNENEAAGASLAPMVVGGVEYAYDIAAIERKMQLMGLGLDEQLKVADQLMDQCVVLEFMDKLDALCQRLHAAITRRQKRHQETADMMKGITRKLQHKGVGAVQAPEGEKKEAPQVVAMPMERVVKAEETVEIEAAAGWLIASGAFVGCEVEQLATLLGGHPTHQLKGPIRCGLDCRELNYLLHLLHGRWWGRLPYRRVCQVMAAGLTDSHGGRYNAESIRSSEKHNADVEDRFAELAAQLKG